MIKQQVSSFLLLSVLLVISNGVMHPQTGVAKAAKNLAKAAKNDECRQAAVLAIRGKWIANPGSRSLDQGACVVSGEEIVLASASRGQVVPSGQITIIYHSGTKPPHTISCPNPEACRNAYRVEQTQSEPSREGLFNSIIDDFFFLFRHGEPTIVPGILHGSLTQSPVVLCNDNGRVDFAEAWPKGVGRHLVNLRSLEGRSNIPQLAFQDSIGVNIPSVLAAYEFEVQTSGEVERTVVLLAPTSKCEVLLNSYENAVKLTGTWPTDTPIEATYIFRAAYLQSLARKANGSQPAK